MNTQKLRTFGTWCTALGTGVQALGIGTNLAASICENRANKAEMKQFKLEEKKRMQMAENDKKLEILDAQRRAEEARVEQISHMDPEAFAKYKAEAEAKANDAIVADAKAQIAKIQQRAEQDILLARSDAQKDIREAKDKMTRAYAERDTAVANYKHINAVFTNRERIEYQIKKIREEIGKARRDPFGGLDYGSVHNDRIDERLRKISDMMNGLNV